jgi:hypothetical protein
VTRPPHRKPDYLVADSDTADAGTEFRHHACKITALTGGKRRWKHVVQCATPDHCLTRIDASSLHLDENFTSSWNRSWNFTHLKNVYATV